MASSAAVESVRIDVNDLKERLEAGEAVTILDVRGTEPWEQSTAKIQGALRLDPYHFHIDPSWPKDRLTVAYCDCPSDATSARIALQLQDAGFRHVHALRGGWEAWRTVNGPVERK